MALAVQIQPDYYYHALWFWVTEDAQYVAGVWREPDGLWVITAGSDLGLPEMRFTRDSDMTPAEADRALLTLWECCKRASEDLGAWIKAPIKVDLHCDGQRAPMILRAHAKAGRIPKGLLS